MSLYSISTMVISTVLIGSHPKDTLLNLQNRLSCHPLAGKFYRAVSVVKPILHCRFKVITSPKVDGIVGWGGGVLLPVVSFVSLISLSHPRVNDRVQLWK